MPFTVGQYLTANDLKSQEDAHTLGYGVVNGLKVIEAPPGMDIEVEIGKAYAADTLVVKGAVTTLTVTGADPTNPRKDIVVCNSAGILSIVAGTPEAALPVGNIGVYTLNPEPPSIPVNSIILGEIWVAAGATEITGSEIYDKRVSIADFLTHKDAATGVHGVGASTVCSETDADNKIGTHTTPNAHHAQAHTLASHSTKAHTELTGVTAAQHHAKYTNAEAIAAAKTDTALKNPSGMIILWHGTIANIPSGWVLCDGGSGTPNLLTRFVEGVATAATNPGATGGATSKNTSGHTHAMPSHYHTMPSHYHSVPNTSKGSGTPYGGAGSYCADRDHTHTIGNTGSKDPGDTHSKDPGDTYSKTDGIADIRPLFYDIAYLMKT